MVFGAFDCLHPGHLDFFKQAKKYGDYLIVSVGTDKNVKKIQKRVYWIIGDQLLRAATSVGANLIEAKASSSKKDFIRFYEIALKSANETCYWLTLLRDSNLVNNSELSPILIEIKEIANMIGASLLTLKNKKI